MHTTTLVVLSSVVRAFEESIHQSIHLAQPKSSQGCNETMTTEAAAAENHIAIFGMGGTIDKDYPRSTNGYAFEIDEPAAGRILSLPGVGVTHSVMSVCKKDSTEVDDEDRLALVRAITGSPARRVVVTHGTDTLIETARFILRSGVATGRRIAFTGSMKPERFKDSDADFNLGGAVAATSICAEGSVLVCMGGLAIPCQLCTRCMVTGKFLASD